LSANEAWPTFWEKLFWTDNVPWLYQKGRHYFKKKTFLEFNIDIKTFNVLATVLNNRRPPNNFLLPSLLKVLHSQPAEIDSLGIWEGKIAADLVAQILHWMNVNSMGGIFRRKGENLEDDQPYFLPIRIILVNIFLQFDEEILT
jgi:hypothetical protein